MANHLNKINMKKQLVRDIDPHTVKQITKLHTETLTRLNQIHDEYKKLALSPINTVELKHLIHHTDNLIKSKCEELIGELPSYGGLKVKKEALMDSLELPNYSAITAKVRELREFWNKNEGNPLILDRFEMQSGQVVLNEASLTVFIDSKRLYAVTEREKEVFTAMKNFLDAYNALDDVAKKYMGGALKDRYGRNPFLPFIYTEAVFDNDNGKPAIKIDLYNTLKG